MHMLVTGAAGFIGSQLVERLLEDGHAVQGIDSLSGYYAESVKLSNLQNAVGNDRLELVRGDLTTMEPEPLTTRADVVFHLAAQPGSQASVREGTALLSELLGRTIAAEHLPPSPGEARETRGETTAAREAFGFEPQITLEEGLRRQVEQPAPVPASSS